MTGAPRPWRILNPRRIEEGLANEEEATREAVLDALERLLANPYEPEGLVVHPIRGKIGESYPDVFHVLLAEGWILSFERYPDDMMPLAMPLLKVRAFLRLI